MSRVLFLAYHFPPTGGSGVQRSLKFVRYLPEFGYEPIVVTGPGDRADRWTPIDSQLERELPPDLTVVRLDGEPSPSSVRRRRAERWLQVETAFSRWWIDGTLNAGSAIESVDLVYASMAPYETGEAALRIARALGTPWVADLRDPWTLDEMRVYPSALHRLHDLRRMRRVLAGADAVIMNTPEAARRTIEAFPELPRVAAISNGFDATDFAGIEPKREDLAFRIVHAGALHLELGQRHRRQQSIKRLLGGSPSDVDILPRSQVFLLDAVERVRTVEPRLGSRIEVHLAGVLSPADRGDATRSFVREHGFMPHAEAIALMRSADLLFLPMHDLPPGTRARIVPGKTYEYLAAGRPILAAIPDGDARDILAGLDHAHLCRPTDSEAMAGAIRLELQRAGSEGRAPTIRPSSLDRFERRVLTARLAEVFDEALSPASRELEPSADRIDFRSKAIS